LRRRREVVTELQTNHDQFITVHGAVWVDCPGRPRSGHSEPEEARTMTGLSLLSRADQRVCVALRDDRLAQGLGDLRWHLPTLLAGGTNTLVIDVSGVARLSSTCVATLLWVKRSCQSRHVRVVLADPTDRTLDVLTRTGLASVFEIESR
jgi:anti-anti-sigma factor